MNVKNILENFGLKLTRNGKYFRCKPPYRESGNPTSLSIHASNGYFVDFSSGLRGPFHKLISLIKNCDTEAAESYLRSNEFEIQANNQERPLIEDSLKVYDIKSLEKLIKDNTYWNNRQISDDILNQLKGGVAISGTFGGRYTFPCFDSLERLVGFAGRAVKDSLNPKWILLGKKSKWLFPHTSLNYIKKEKSVYLVESIGDCLKLMEAGINNIFVLFGIELSDTILSKLNSFSLDKIYICTNRDAEKNGGVGERAAQDIFYRLSSFFDVDKVEIKLPPIGKNDLGEMSVEEILEWKNLC